MTDSTKRLRELLAASRQAVFFGGAGVSTESGIPDFRSAHGLYAKKQGLSYEEMLSDRYFYRHPAEFWDFYRRVMLYPDAKPNPAHLALARLEKQGKLKTVLTQNIDGLHQAAGSRNVLELHGSVRTNTCVGCGRKYDLSYVTEAEGKPVCSICGGDLHPDIVLYGEPLDDTVTEAAVKAVQQCDLLIVGGTSLVVYPAAGFVRFRKPSTPLVLINRDETSFDAEADLVIRENIAEVLDAAVDA